MKRKRNARKTSRKNKGTEEKGKEEGIKLFGFEIRKRKEEKKESEEEKGQIKILGMGIGKTFLAICATVILLYIIGFGYFYFLGEKPSFSIVEKEERLEKNTELQIAPGESYTYEYGYNDTSVFQAEYDVKSADGCTIIATTSYSNITVEPVCIDEWGNDKGGKNLTYENSTIYLFSPWMLAVTDGWKWNVSITMAAEGLGFESTSKFMFETVSEEKKFGRDSYKVTVTMSSDENATEEQMTWWIDKEKRVLLMEKMGDDEVKLVKAPFALEQQ